MGKERKIPEINAGSMADIAFLLLVFFLVTTTISTDTGVGTMLPPWIPPDKLKDLEGKVEIQNLYAIQVNGANQILMRDKIVDYREIKPTIIEFITNYGKRSDYSESPEKAIVSLLNDKSTSYDTYLTVYNEVKAAYNTVRQGYARQTYGRPMEELTEEEQKEVRLKFPIIISEAEPSDNAAK